MVVAVVWPSVASARRANDGSLPNPESEVKRLFWREALMGKPFPSEEIFDQGAPPFGTPSNRQRI